MASGIGPGKPPQPVDLERDIGEENNVASDNPEVVARIREILKDAHVPNDFYDLTREDFMEMKGAISQRGLQGDEKGDQ